MIKKILKIVGFVLAGIMALLLITIIFIKVKSVNEARDLRKLLGEQPTTITINGFTFRDLNKNGRLDVYEDTRALTDNRVEDLVSQMTLEEKAGSMFITMSPMNSDGSVVEEIPLSTDMTTVYMAYSMGTVLKMIVSDKMNYFNLLQALPARQMAEWNNNMQRLAERTRLGIPITIASDPRNYFSTDFFALPSGGMSQWPQQPGFAAIGDTNLMRQFGDIARQEYLVVGIRVALHPMADLATEPRWPRCSGTFGEDADLAAKMVRAYILGFQNGDSLNKGSVACMTKHFSGGGPQKEGLDPHFDFQKGQAYPGNNFQYHLKPFEAALKAKTASIMPYYGMPTGQTSEDVGFSFNKEIITGLLREKYKFDGVVCTDWGLVTDIDLITTTWAAKAWGVEKLSREERVLKIINAGCDQFGGESCPELVVNLVKSGKLSEDRINLSVKRLMKQKFILGLFDNPFVDVEKAVRTVGKPEWKALGEQTQSRAVTLLKNESTILPLTKKYKIYIKNVNKVIAEKYGVVVDKPEDADFAIVRANTPWVPVGTKNFVARQFHHGDLDFKGKEKAELLDICKRVFTIFNIYLDRPAVFPEINALAKAVIADYGASDEAVLDVIFGKAKPQGRLPFELPSSMEAVKNQKEDMPYDSQNPLYKFGFGMSYSKK